MRLVGIHTYAESGNDAHMAVAELRVREADKRVDISAEDSQITVSVPETDRGCESRRTESGISTGRG